MRLLHLTFPALLLLLCLVLSTNSLDLIDATYSVKEVPLLGNQYKWAVYEAQFDEEIYLMTQWACPCINESIPCPVGPTKTAPLVDENLFNSDGSRIPIVELQENVWYNGSIMNPYDVNYLKFKVQYNPLKPCPMITVEFQTEVGTLTTFVSARAMPTIASFDWTHQFFAPSTFVICPSNPMFYYGYYYVLVSNMAGRVANIYSARFTIANSPTCNTPIVDYASIPSPVGTFSPQTWIQDGIPRTVTATGAAAPPVQYYKFYAPGRCSNFTVSLYKNDFSAGEVILLVSPTYPNPSPLTPNSYDWFSILNGDDRVDVYYCNPDEAATYTVFYIGIFVSGYAGQFQLVATTQRYTPNVALSSYAFTQSRLELTFGAAPKMTCDVAVHTCTFFSFKGCEFQPVGCCQVFGPAAPTEVVQTVWPWNTGEVSVGNFHTAINWTDFSPLVPGKLAWGMLLEYTSDLGVRNVITTANPGTCNITLGSMFTNAKGEPMTVKTLSFKPKKVECDLEKYQAVISKMRSISEKYLELSDSVYSLAAQQLRLVISSFDPIVDACSEFVSQLTESEQRFELDSVFVCSQKFGTAAYNADPCCNPAMLATKSCRPTNVSRVLPIEGIPAKSRLEERCENFECSTSNVQTWIQQTSNIAQRNTGCQDNFNSQASLSRAEDLVSFVWECKLETEGLDLLGASCNTDADCRNGAPCVPETRRCNSTYTDVLQCMSEKIQFDTALSLFIGWNITEIPNIFSQVEQFKDNWVRDICVGPNANQYRKGYHYTLITPTCVDTCLLQGLEPYCTDMTKARTPGCEVPAICDKAITPSACFRYWQPVVEDNNGCLASKICNWRNSTYFPCPPGVIGDCTSRCLDSPTAYACLDCSQNIDGTCLEVESIDTQARCALGLCTADESITDPAACALAGICSKVDCPTCATQAQCESTGTCSDFFEFRNQIQAGRSGACLRTRTWTGTEYRACSGGTVATTIGCINTTITTQAACLSWGGGAFWHEFSTNSSECAENSEYRCYDNSRNLYFLGRTQAECAICPTCVWQQVYTWNTGVWTPGRMQPLVWEERMYYHAAKVAPAVDYTKATIETESAITRDFAYAYYSDSLCRYDTANSLVSSIVCDCNSASGQCFVNTGKTPIGSIAICPYQSRSLQTLVATLTMTGNTVPLGSPCQVVEILATSVGKYQVPPDHSVTHALFKKIESNPYLIVVNDKKAIVGQLLSDAATVEFDFIPAEPIRICIRTEDFIRVESATSVYTLAQLQSDNSIRVFDGGIETGPASQVCGYIENPGTYFAVAVVPKFRSINPSPSAETIVACCIYLSLAVFAFIQGILIILDRHKQRLLPFKLVAIFIVMLNTAVRVVYMIPPANAFGKGSEAVQFIIFELPTFLYFSVFTVVVYLWISVVLTTNHFGKKAVADKKELIRRLFIYANVFMYYVFVVFIFLIALLPGAAKKSPCFLGNLDSAITTVERSIKIAYWIFQMVVSILLITGFLIAAISLLRIVMKLNARNLGRSERRGKKDANTSANVQMIIITVVAFVCVIFLLIRSILFLEIAINGSTIHVIAFCILEFIPQAMLVFYMHPFKCFREAGRSSSSKSSSKSSTKMKSSDNSGKRGKSSKLTDEEDDL